MKLFYGDCIGMSHDELVEFIIINFQVEKQIVDNYNIIFANSSLCDYEESLLMVLSSKIDGKLYIIDASHCSCYGFEGQFEPDVTDIRYLLSDNAYFGWSISDSDKINIKKQLLPLTRYIKIEHLKERMG